MESSFLAFHSFYSSKLISEIEICSYLQLRLSISLSYTEAVFLDVAAQYSKETDHWGGQESWVHIPAGLSSPPGSFSSSGKGGFVGASSSFDILVLSGDYGADKDDHRVAVALGEVSDEFKSSRPALASCGIKSKRACFANVLYLAHQLWELIPPGDHG